jgi:hypothetical protein
LRAFDEEYQEKFGLNEIKTFVKSRGSRFKPSPLMMLFGDDRNRVLSGQVGK